jgi:diacylglycerol kinase (ATP)
LPAIREAFAKTGVTEVRLTEQREGERAVARRAIEDGFDTIVACGGDGTWGNVANAILSMGAHDVRLGLIASGTGNDFAKTVGAPASDFAATAQLVADGRDTRVDVGKIEDQFFLNITGFGFDIAVLEDIPKIPLLRGDAVYIVSALRQIVGYGGVDIDIVTSARTRGTLKHLMLVIANAKNFGGAFKIAPGASLSDGKLDAIAIYDAPALKRLGLFAAAVKGTHVSKPGVSVEQAAKFSLTFSAPPAYETDGEYRQAKSDQLEVTCLASALRVVAK